ncbi:hypothetical protein B0T22DRAFT_89448 [Podospora appendiculata]|uniref:DH domain-containing protein n=1 Tax=Podospora appendiculata TaxID=314037 RepID=A0AAE0XKK4_9PEZI|nr:hypothetical protein B0T22DRAFT_89448 [Podospora appendiculata]
MDEGNHGDEAALRPGPFSDHHHTHTHAHANNVDYHQHNHKLHQLHHPHSSQIYDRYEHQDQPQPHIYPVEDDDDEDDHEDEDDDGGNYHRGHNRHHHHHHNHPHHNGHPDADPGPGPDEAPPAPAFEPRPSQIPVALSYAAPSLEAFAANAPPHEPFASPVLVPVDPDDFYRSYRGIQPSNAALPLEPVKDSMASPVPNNRQNLSLRSNGNGTTPKHPPVPAARAGLKPGFRSVSSTVDDRLGHADKPSSAAAVTTTNGYSGAPGAYPPSVKDLKKKFDQTASQSASATRKANPRPIRDTAPGSANGRSSASGGGTTPYNVLRASATRDTGHEAGKASGARGTQRQKAPSHDQPSTSSQSFANRISRPRSSVSSNAQASKSMTHLSSSSPSPGLPTPPPALPRPNGLLFGEILPEENDSATVGFGIEEARPRRTSESSALDLGRTRPRSFSDPDLDPEPSSPTDWYRGAASIPTHQEPEQNASRIPKNHSRAHSDLAGSKQNVSRIKPRAPRQNTELGPNSPTSPTSRLPVLAKRMSGSANLDSPMSSRSNSPAAAKYAPASGRTSRQHGAAAIRAKTPTARSTTPTTVVKTPGSNRKAPPSNIATSSSGRLNAYVSVPTPRLSPSLRSSRPRQSVATATTAASRLRANEGAPPLRPGMKSIPRPEQQDESATRRRKVSVGPIDFAQRRETIKLAYSKSIRETQAKEARQAAADRRKKELEAVARAKVEAEAAAVAAAVSAATLQTPISPRASENARSLETAVPRERKPAEPPLKITTNLTLLQPLITETSSHLASPTLGMPGSFPDNGLLHPDHEEIPQSAISTTSAVTEFDAEEQTDPPRLESESTAIDDDLGNMLTSQDETAVEEDEPDEKQLPPTLHKTASYHYPFDDEEMEDERVSIKISLDPSAQPSPQLTPTRSDFNLGSGLPPSSHDEYEPRPYTYSSPIYGTTVTILGPENDFKPSYKDQPRDTLPASDLLQSDEALADESSEEAAHGESHAGDSLREQGQVEVEHLERLEDFYVGPHLRDNIASLRDSTFTSSDHDASYDAQPSPAEYQRTLGPSHSLRIPEFRAPADRLSHHSSWTDFSFGSDDPDTNATGSAPHSHDLETREARSSSKPASSLGDLDVQRLNLDPIGRGLDFSPLDQSDALSPSMLADSLLQNHKLLPDPDTDTAESFSISYSQEATNVPVLPDHAPPPPPGEEYDLGNSPYIGVTRPNSYLHSQDDESEDLTQVDSTPHSIEQFSLEPPEPVKPTHLDGKALSTEAHDALETEQKRLRQRHLVIRELIDTEELFVRDMSVVEEIYKGTAEACPKLDSKTIKLIFRNTDEIIVFHSSFLAQLKEGAASVYVPKGRRSPPPTLDSRDSDSVTMHSTTSGGTSSKPDMDDERDRLTSIGPLFTKNIAQLKAAHEFYLRSSDHSSKRLVHIQEDPTVMVWLNECNEVAKELTSAWNLDSLLIKPMQRLTKYPDIITHLLKHTPADHPDREALVNARTVVIDTIDDINKTKKNFELVGQIVGNRKRKDSDVRAGLARLGAFGKRVDKLQASNTKTAEDEEFLKLHEKFADDYLRLQVVLRDVEYYTRNVATYVHEFLQYLSSMELVMRLQPSRDYAHIESKWVQFNVSMRDIEKIALEKHLSDVRKHVIEPFEQVIRCYGNPSLAMKKRAKRRLDYEKFVQLKANGKKVDKQLHELVEQYEALNDTLRKELPKLSTLTAKIGNICLGKFVSIQASWYSIWKDKVKGPLQDGDHVPEVAEIVHTFQREFGLQEERAKALGILNPAVMVRTSQSTTDDASSILSKTRSRQGDLLSPRGRGSSVNSDHIPSLPTPDFGKRNSGQFSLSPTGPLPSPGQYYRDYYSGINGHPRGSSNSPITPEPSSSRQTLGLAARPSTSRSYDTVSLPRQSSDSTAQSVGLGQQQSRRDSSSTFNSSYPLPEARRLSGLFHSALPLPDGPEDSQRSSRASSRERGPASSSYRIMWLAASLFEFNIETTKHEAGYPYLTYQAGEIFDVIAEKGELWLAKNQDDPNSLVGWIWSKHFAKLADS